MQPSIVSVVLSSGGGKLVEIKAGRKFGVSFLFNLHEVQVAVFLSTEESTCVQALHVAGRRADQ